MCFPDFVFYVILKIILFAGNRLVFGVICIILIIEIRINRAS